MTYKPDVEKFKQLHEMQNAIEKMNEFISEAIKEERIKCKTIEDFISLKDAAPDCVERVFLFDTIRQMQKQNS